MHWDWQNRSISLSVGELARFSLLSGGDDASGRWRAELGVHWHQVLQERTRAEDPRWLFECPVSGTIWQDGWQFHLKGRMDQFRPDAQQAQLREIKTISCELPAEDDYLRELYPQYFHQAMLYAFLLGKEAAFPDGDLVFLEIQTGLSQSVGLKDVDLEILHKHLETVVKILEERRSHFHRLRNLSIPPPFADWRPGQEAARDDLILARQTGNPILFEAPTGYGKTGLVLEQALKQLASGEIERILVLTGKNTGHSPLLDQLDSYLEIIPDLTVQALRSRKDLSLDHDLEKEISSAEIADRWRESGLSAPELLGDGILDLTDLQQLGKKYGIPPWAINRMLLPYADVWIADFNYLFDPAVAQLFEYIPTFDPGKTCLIIDEAHNLPGRAAASRSHLLNYLHLERLLTEVQFARFPGQLAQTLDILYTQIKRLGVADSLDPPAEADLLVSLREIQAILSSHAPGEDELSEDSRDVLWSIPRLLSDWDQPGLPMNSWCPSKGTLLFSCLDASSVIKPVLEDYKHVLLMSATLQPWPDFKASIGYQKDDPTIQVIGQAPWLEGCFEVLVDARVDTRYRIREKYFELTARTIAESALDGRGCTVAFFPSYRYAETVLERLQFLYPALRAELQPRKLPLEEQQTFLETALLLDDVLFLVLGSRFSEGIDALGGKVTQAIVVSPALPEVNAIQRAKEALVPGGQVAAFKSVYLIPAMRKISQALGRLVRSPEQHARVLLHGKRFLEPDYQDLLPEYLQPLDHLVTDKDFVKKWLKSS